MKLNKNILGKKNSKYSALNILLIFATTYCILVAAGTIYISPPWKIVDPSQEGFDKQKFHLTDYASRKELQEALSVMFPVGTSKAYVDEVINSSGKVEIERYVTKYPPDEGKTIYQYGHYSAIRQLLPMFFLVPGPPPPAYRVLVEYDEDFKLKAIRHIRTIGLEWHPILLRKI